MNTKEELENVLDEGLFGNVLQGSWFRGGLESQVLCGF